MLYFTFVHPQLLYGVKVYANTCKSHLEKLIVLNNKLLRIAQNCSVRTCIVDLYKRYFTLPLPLLHEYNVLCFVHKCYYSSLSIPDVFKDYFRPITSFIFMVLGLMTGYISTLLIHRLV